MLLVDGVEMLDVREAATLAGRTPETVRRWIWSGRLTALRRGNRLLVARRDLDALLRGSATGGSATSGSAAAAVDITLADWLRLVRGERKAGRLGRQERATAADLVVADRRGRQEN